jgi:hypothetical protein
MLRLFKLILVIALLYFVGHYFYFKNYLVLNRSEFSGVTEIDTLEAYPEKGLYILGLVRPGLLGNFSYDLGITKTNTYNPSKIIKYEVDKERQSFSIGKDYIALVEGWSYDKYGWFHIKNGKIMETLPSITKLEDSIKLSKAEKAFINHINGYINLFINGKVVESFNYGNLILQNKINFDSLDYHIYTLSQNRLIKTSNNPNDLLKQSDGLYFIPKPGYGVISKYSKREILNSVESTVIKNSSSTKIRIKAVLN